MMSSRHLFAFLLLLPLLVSGCGGSGGGSDTPPERPTSAVSGRAVDALIRNGTVTVYSWRGGSRGAELGSGRTDDEGHYEIEIQAEDQPILVQIEGGTYTEEASGQDVSLRDGEQLLAVTNYTSGEPIDVMLTPYTTLQTALAEYNVAQGVETNNAIAQATSTIAGITGIDILGTVPIDITDPSHQDTTTLTDEIYYGFLTAGLSAWTRSINEAAGREGHSAYTSIQLALIMYRDLKLDGVLNGRGLSASGNAEVDLAVGPQELGPTIYRRQIALGVLHAGAGDYNATAMTPDMLLERANQFASRVNPVFANEPPLPIDEEGPQVSRVDAVGSLYGGVIDYTVDVVDTVGVVQVSAMLDGTPVATINEPNGREVTFSIDTTGFADGDHVFRIEAIDQLNNVATAEWTLRTDNTGASLAVTSDLITNHQEYILRGTYSDPLSDIERITVNGVEAGVHDDGTWSHTVTLAPGENEFTARAVDALGNESAIESTILYDGAAPVISTPEGHSQAEFRIGDTTVTRRLQDDTPQQEPIFLSPYTVSLDGTPIEEDGLAAADIPFYRVSVADLEQQGVFTASEDLQYQVSYEIAGRTQTEQSVQPASVTNGAATILIPLATEILGDQWLQASPDERHDLTLTATDEAGNAASRSFSFYAYFDFPTVTITSPVVGGSATMYRFINGEKGGEVGSCSLGDTGSCSFAAFTDADAPVIVEITGGSYREYGTGSEISLGSDDALQAVSLFQDTDTSISVTPLTHAAVGHAQDAIDDGAAEADAVAAANTALSDAYGVDIVGVVPANPSDPANASPQITPELRYGFILAGLSSWTMDAALESGGSQATYNSVLFGERMRQDLAADGLLDGSAGNEALWFGNISLHPNVYRAEIARQILYVSETGQNATSHGPAELLDMAQHVSGSEHVIYAGEPTEPLDDTPPQISFNHQDGMYVEETVTLSATVSDATGVAGASWDWDGTSLGDASSPTMPTIEVDTLNYSNGSYTVGLTATDLLGNSAQAQLRVLVDNTPPELEITSETLINETTHTVEGTVTDTGAGVDTIQIANVTVTPEADGSWSAVLNLQQGTNELPVTITDNRGKTYNHTHAVDVDLVAPTFDYNTSSVAYYVNGSVQYSQLPVTDFGHPLYLTDSQTRFGGSPLTMDGANGRNIVFWWANIADTPDNGVYTDVDELQMEIRYRRDGEVVLGWHERPELYSYGFPNGEGRASGFFPLADEILGDDWSHHGPDVLHQIDVRVTDQAGNVGTITFSATAYVVPEPMALQRSEDLTGPFAGQSFSSREGLYDATTPVAEYTFTNPHSQPVLMRVGDAGDQHVVDRTVGTWERVHRARVVTRTEWRARTRDFSGEGCSDLSDWYQIDNYAHYRYGAYRQQTRPAASYADYESVETDTPTAPAADSWSDVQRYAAEDLSQDQVRDLRVGEGIYAYFRGDEWTTGTPQQGFVQHDTTHCDTGPYLQARQVYSYESQEGYPRNEREDTVTETPFSATTFEVMTDTHGELSSQVGWYRIPAGASVTVRKLVNTPSLPVQDFDAITYDPRERDERLDWTLDQSIRLDFVKNMDPRRAGDMPYRSIGDSGTAEISHCRGGC